jgi:hypothetical protein
MRVELFIDPVSGRSWWTPALLVEDEPRADQERAEAGQRPAGQGLLVRLLGRVGAWFGSASRPHRVPGSGSRWPAGPQGSQAPRQPPHRLELVVPVTGHRLVRWSSPALGCDVRA